MIKFFSTIYAFFQKCRHSTLLCLFFLMALSLTLNESAVVQAATTVGIISIGEQQVSLADLYVKIDSITGNKDFLSFVISFNNPDKLAERTFSFQPDIEGPNFIQQAYLYLKTLPEFADSVDC